jgi:hypothetical protein
MPSRCPNCGDTRYLPRFRCGACGYSRYIIRGGVIIYAADAAARAEAESRLSRVSCSLPEPERSPS